MERFMVKNRSATRYTDNYYQAVCCFAHTAPLLHAVQALHGMHPMRPLHVMHHVHQCTRFTTAVRRLARTARATTDAMRDLVKQFRGIRSETAYALAARGARCRQSHRVAASGYHNLLLAPAERRGK